MRKIYIIGHVKTIDNETYTYVNNHGTLEKIGKFPWYILLYLEVRQGLNKPLSLIDLRKLCLKYNSIRGKF